VGTDSLSDQQNRYWERAWWLSVCNEGTNRVLDAYLSALLETGRVAEAISTYEAWSRDRLVPPPATNSPSEAVILPTVQQTRLSYARALLKNDQWEAASREFEVLSATGVKPGAQESAELRARLANAGADATVLTSVSTGVDQAAPWIGQADSRPECNIGRTTQLPRLTDQPTLIPQQVHVDAGVLATLTLRQDAAFGYAMTRTRTFPRKRIRTSLRRNPAVIFGVHLILLE
jgi:hypothetical protein